MKKYLIYTIILVIGPFITWAQNPNGDFNPYVHSGIIAPSPIWPTEANGNGLISFTLGNSGADPLEVFDDQYITLTITLSYGLPDAVKAVDAVGGSAAGLFSWKYFDGTFSATQVAEIPGDYSGTISIAYRVTQNSDAPGLNGFNVNISPAPYQTDSNALEDDAVNSYTYTEIRDYGDAPESYGIAWHVVNFKRYLGVLVDGEYENQPSEQADADDLAAEADDDGVEFPEQIRQGDTITLPVTVKGMGYLNAWIDWNGDGDFEDNGERIGENVGSVDETLELEVIVPLQSMIAAPTYARFRLSYDEISSSYGAGYIGEVEDYMIQLSSSPNAPSAPSGLMIDDITEVSVTLQWSDTGNDAVAYYRIYRDGSLLGTTENLSYTDNTVSYGNSYNYTVTAVSEGGLESNPSEPVHVEIEDYTAPSVPEGLSVEVVGSSAIHLSWEASTDNIGVALYRVYRDELHKITTNKLEITDSTINSGIVYAYSVSAVDAAGNESDRSAPVSIGTTDAVIPTVPTGLKVLSVTSRGLELVWFASSDNIAVEGYYVFRDGIEQSSIEDTIFQDGSVILGHTYMYSVSAFDAAGNESERSEQLSVTVASTEYLEISELVISPNPSQGTFFIELDGGAGEFVVELATQTGNIIGQEKVSLEGQVPALSLNYTQLPPGLYNLRIYNAKRIYFGKLMIIQ